MPPARGLPEWWNWEFDCSLPHLRKRMIDRAFSEADIRMMLATVESIEPDHEPERWLAKARHGGSQWEVVLEPLYNEQIVLVVTAYKVQP